mgnify:CR=1 FL=1
MTDLSLTPYLVPQECGMRMDTEWLEIADIQVLTIVEQISHHRHSVLRRKTRNLLFHAFLIQHLKVENALHHEELPPARRTVLCVYGAVRGVGGIDSWQSDVEDEYHISAEEDIRYSFTIC